MDTALINSLAQFGPGIVLAAIVFVAYERHVTSLQDVIRSNTEALTKVAAVLDQSCVRISDHDQRADRIELDVRHAAEQIDRVEKAVTSLSRSRTKAAHDRGEGVS